MKSIKRFNKAKKHFHLTDILCSVIITFIFGWRELQASQAELDLNESNISENLRFAIDLSSRVSAQTVKDEIATQNIIGIDLHKVFSNKGGDWGTLTLQGYLTRIDNQTMKPGFFDDSHDWEFVYGIFNFNYTGLGNNLPNIKIGHLEIPYGLESTIVTNDTIRDYIHSRNLGMKTDWGMTLNGETANAEYEFGLSRGTGQDLYVDGQNDSYALSGQIGSSRNNNVIWGLSSYYANLKSQERFRVGVDTQAYH